MTTTVTYHHGEDGIARPAIDVKDHNGGQAYRIAAERAMGVIGAGAIGLEGDITIAAMAYEHVRSDFWATAEQVAAERGLGEIFQEGRSGGWLVFTDGRDPQDMTTFRTVEDALSDEMVAEAKRERAEWLAAYRAMSEWADQYIADAPRKVAALAQQWAMDEAGEAAALRMFAFGRAA